MAMRDSRFHRRRSRWNTEDDMDISNSDDERRTRSATTDQIREGILFPHPNYYQFLMKWMAEANQRNPRYPKQLLEKTSNATPLEIARINLKEEEKVEVVHCDITVTGLPACIFFGSGYGPQRKLSHFASSKDFMDTFLKLGLITKDLHEAVGSNPELDWARRLPDMVKAIDVLKEFGDRMAKYEWPVDIYTARMVGAPVYSRLEGIIAECREAVHGPNAPIYDERICKQCKRILHLDTCPILIEQDRVAQLKRNQEERRKRRSSRSRSRERRRSRSRERREKERIEIENQIIAQREALRLQEEEQERKRRERDAAERGHAVAMSYGGIGGGVLPSMGGPSNTLLHNPSIDPHYLNPFHPLVNHPIPDMSRTSGFGQPSGGMRMDPVTIPNSYMAHVAALEVERAARMRQEEEEARLAKQREEEQKIRQELEVKLRAEMEQKLYAEIEQRRIALEEEMRQKLAPREVRRFGDINSAMSAYGLNINNGSSTSTISAFGQGSSSTSSFSQSSAISPSYGQPSSTVPSIGQPAPTVSPFAQSGTALSGYGGLSSSAMTSTPAISAYTPGGFGGAPVSSQVQPSLTSNGQLPTSTNSNAFSQLPKYPEVDEIGKVLLENEEFFTNLKYAKDYDTIMSDPVLRRVDAFAQDSSSFDRPSLKILLHDVTQFVASLKKRAEDGRRMPIQTPSLTSTYVPPARDDTSSRSDRDRERDRGRRRSRSRSRSYERRKDYGGRGGGGDYSDEEVIVQVGSSRFRQLRPREAMLLKKNDVVVAQDLKNGKWSTAKVARVSDRRVHLTVGNAQWKKEFNEVYRPI